jgi:hypothetical protein
MKKIFLLLASSAMLFACNKDKDKDKVFQGTQVQMHGGKLWTSGTLNKDGVPQQVSIVMQDAVLNSVPVGGTGDGHDDHNNDIFLPLNSKITAATPFRSVMVDWNKNGHEPAGVYTVPHFDLHFYMTPESEVMNYTDMTKIDQNLPSTDYVPANHIAGPGVPMMGKHWVDVTSPELNGGQFTQTFIYGSYDSKMVFYEPMITLDFLKQTTSFERPIPQPAKFQVSGYYPTRLKVSKHDGVTEIILKDFVKRQAS